MMEGTKFTADVFDISFEGYGVVRNTEGKIFFVDGLIPGERAEIEVVKQNKKFGYAVVNKLLVASESRRDAPCLYHGFSETECGGCSWMYIEYSKQLELKQCILKGLFKKKNIALDTPIDIVPASKALGYRGRARLFVQDGRVGFLAKNTKSLVPVKECLALESNLNTKLQKLSEAASGDPKLHSPTLGFVEIDKNSSIKKIELNQPVSFSQANASQNDKMLSWLKEDLSRVNARNDGLGVLELFSGAGNFTKILAEALSGAAIQAVEISKEATYALAQKKMKDVKVSTVDIYNMTELQKTLSSKKADLVFLDPPRAGYKNLAKLLELLDYPKIIYYISCNADSFCNDTQPLLQKGYKLETLKLFDMFPNTPHIELLAKLKI